MRAVVVALCILASRIASAQVAAPLVDDRPAEPGAVAAGAELVDAGTVLGENNKYELALGKFLVAAAEHPSATHDCYVALAYVRIGRLTLARLWLDAAHHRGDALPVWCAGKISDELSRALETRGFVEVSVAVEPNDAEVWIDEGHFRGGRAVWLPPGTIEVRAEASGYVPHREQVTAAAGARVAIQLSRAAPLVPDAKITRPAPRASRTGAWISTLGGGALLAGGAVFHVLAVRTRDEANGVLATSPRFATLDERFVRERAVAVAGYTIGAGAVALGIWLFTRERTESRVGVAASPHEVAVTWSWTR